MDDDEEVERVLESIPRLPEAEALKIWTETLEHISKSPAAFTHDLSIIQVAQQLSSSFYPPLLRHWRLTNEPRRAYRLACRLYRIDASSEWLQIAWICWLTMDTIDRHLVGDKFIKETLFNESQLLPLTVRERRAIIQYYDRSERAQKIAKLLK